MSKKYSWGIALLACALAVGWLLATPGVATAFDFESELFNLTRVGGDQLEPYTFAKLDARGHLDGHILYTGCYLPDQCFRVVDVQDPENLVLLAYPPVFDMVNAPAPPVPPGGINYADHSDPRWIIWYSSDYNYPYFETGAGVIKESVPADPTDTPEYCTDWVGWKVGDPMPDPPYCWDPGWNTHSHYVQENNKILVANQERYRTAGTSKRPSYAGLTIWDVRNPAIPVFLSRFEFPKGTSAGPVDGSGNYTNAGGVHHFFFDGRHVMGGAEHGPLGSHIDGFNDRIFFVVDLKDPKNPKEVGDWWVPGQANDEYRYWIPVGNFSSPIYIDSSNNLHQKVGLHYTFVKGNRAYLSYHHAGVIILDITKKTNPKFISRLDYLLPPNGYTDTMSVDHERPPLASGEADVSPDDEKCFDVNKGITGSTGVDGDYACGNTHAAKIVPGRNLLMVSDEYFSCPYGHVRLVDISDETDPRVISHFYYDTQLDCSRDWGPGTTPSAHLGFGANANLYWMAWYAYGLRGIDISDPEHMKEAAHFFYRILDDESTSVTYDVAHGPHGLLYLTDNVSGIRVLDYKEVEPPVDTLGP